MTPDQQIHGILGRRGDALDYHNHIVNLGPMLCYALQPRTLNVRPITERTVILMGEMP